MPLRVRGMYQMTKLLGMGSSGRVMSAFHVLTGSEVALKSGTASEDTPDMPCVEWSRTRISANLEQLRRLSRGELSWKTVVMLGVQMFNRIEFAHSRGVILRDIKPKNFAMGVGEKSHIVYLFDFGLAKLYVDPSTGAHIPYREERVALGTMPYSSYNVHFGREQGRRDDLEALGNVLLYLLHGRLPWEDIYAQSKEAQLRRIGEMKAGSAFRDLLARSPSEFTTQLFSQIMEREGWAGDARIDPLDGSSDKGTLVPEEYQFDARFTKGDLTTLQVMIPRSLWLRKKASTIKVKEKVRRPVLDLNSAAFN
ncbi:CK1 family protein kinase [Suillus subluteus]|nr:CK1 family protein kinase [Suillus subluteus]